MKGNRYGNMYRDLDIPYDERPIGEIIDDVLAEMEMNEAVRESPKEPERNELDSDDGLEL